MSTAENFLAVGSAGLENRAGTSEFVTATEATVRTQGVKVGRLFHMLLAEEKQSVREGKGTYHLSVSGVVLSLLVNRAPDLDTVGTNEAESRIGGGQMIVRSSEEGNHAATVEIRVG